MMRIAIDTGGTFTDRVYVRDGQIEVLKTLSTPADPGRAVLDAIRQLAPGTPAVSHGTTVGTNALLERKGARVAFVTTAGFEDIIAIGRQARPTLFDLFFTKPEPLAVEELRFGVRERIASDGSVLQAPCPEELRILKEKIVTAAPEAIAVSLLFAFANPVHEKEVARVLAEVGVPISVSYEILPEFREYERASTVLINAYLAPKMQRYLSQLDEQLAAQSSTLHVMQSSGGIISAAIAAREPVRTILSGPAGGVIGSLAVAASAGFQKIITFDMGGTSTDVALIDAVAGLRTTTEAQVTGFPVAVPMLDIHTVGAGGGSLAAFDRGGALQVGPQSAGTDPGPICYGNGLRPTVTDANLLLGRLDADWFLGGGMQLKIERTKEQFAASKGALNSIEEFAEGIVRVANSHMARAIRRISIEQGHDPRDFVLLSFGGAGPLHACDLARACGISRVLVPNFPGALSAYGILVSDIVRDYSRTVMRSPGDNAILHHFDALEKQALADMTDAGLTGRLIRSVDMRYGGQGYEIAVGWSEEIVASFHRLHEQRFGYADPRRPVEVVNVRVQSIVPAEKVAIPEHALGDGHADRAVIANKKIYHDGQWRSGRVYDRSQLQPADEITGPAVIVEYSATTFLPPGALARIDRFLNIVIEVGA